MSDQLFNVSIQFIQDYKQYRKDMCIQEPVYAQDKEIAVNKLVALYEIDRQCISVLEVLSLDDIDERNRPL